MTDTVEKFLKPILKACEGKRYLFRGTTKSHEEINSSLYRWAVKKEVKFHEKYHPFNMEEEILNKTKRHFADSTSNIEILTDLQHFQGKTNLIDFSRNLYIALFFSCYGDEEHHKEDGELILLDPAKIGKERQEVNYTELRSSSDPFPIEPANTQFSQKRVTFQNSVFVYPPSGYINKDLCEPPVLAPAYLKKSILDHLREVHNIHTDTIYNDLIGFIDNEKNYETSAVLFYQGLATYNKGEYEEAIQKYNEGIELNPNHAEFYNNRGLAKNKLEQHSNAIDDYDKAIELKPNDADAYNNRGAAKDFLRQYQEAIADYSKAIELKPNYAEAYINRGAAKDNLGQYQEAITDYDKAIELNPNRAEAYYNRGNVKYHLELHSKAIADYDNAIELNPKYAKAYHNRGVAYQALGRTQEADEDFKMAAKLKSDEAS